MIKTLKLVKTLEHILKQRQTDNVNKAHGQTSGGKSREEREMLNPNNFRVRVRVKERELQVDYCLIHASLSVPLILH